MKLNPPLIAGAGIVWLGTMTAAYYLGRNQGASPDASHSTSLVTVSTNGSADSAGDRGKASAGTTPGQTSSKPQTVKQILAKVKNAMRGGSMQNPMAMMKSLALLDAIPAGEITAALAELDSISDPQQKMMIQMTLLGKWAETDGAAAMKYAEDHPAGAGMMGQVSKMGVISAWAEKDPEAVWKWYKDQPEDAGTGMFGNNMSLAAIFSSMAAKDPDLAFKRLEEIDGQGRTMALSGMLQSAMFDDEKRKLILSKVDSMPDETERKQARQMILGQMAMTSPDQAMEWIKTLPAADQPEMRQSAGTMLLMSDPKKGAAFVMEGATEETRPQLYSQVVSTWAMSDVNGAGNWLKEQPQGPQLDPARQAFVNAASGRDPESAMVWAGTITNPDTRVASTAAAYEAWKKKDAAAAERGLTGSGLSPEQIDTVRSGAVSGASPAPGALPQAVEKN